MMTFKDDDPLKKVVDSYCYITGTYTVDKLQYGEVSVRNGLRQGDSNFFLLNSIC